MKYIAIFDDNFLDNFRVDVKSCDPYSDMVLVVTDKAGCQRGVRLHPISEVENERFYD